MNLTGEYELAASREAVWQALNDPEVLEACIPGCESFEQLSPTQFAAVAVAKVGPVKARFKGQVELSDIVTNEGYRITGEGKGGAAGFARGGALVSLKSVDAGTTTLSYEVEANVGGKLAQVGQRLIGGAAKKLADKFFQNFSDHLAGEDK